MSGPELSENTEDVLSSIRRLVAGEEGDGTAGAPLLLTPAQRVDRGAVATHEAPLDDHAPYVLTHRIDNGAAEDELPPETLEWHDSDAAGFDSAAGTPDVDLPADTSPEPQDVASEGRALERVEEQARVDDAALRALVAEIVREELTGELGDRITRNVRKLVRREINRVLSGRTTE